MRPSSKFQAATQRSVERREAEEGAPRLIAQVPSLRSARIQITEMIPTGTTKHIKHVVVASAPALFIIPCGDKACRDGSHDLTAPLMSAFRRRLTSAVGENSCEGTCGTAPCGRSIRYELVAEYADQ